MENFPKEDELRKIITNPESGDLLVYWADIIGNALSRSLTTSQIRALFSEVRNIQGMKKNYSVARRRLVLLKPKMAYRARKERGKGVEDLVNVLSPAIDLVKEDPDKDMFTQNFDRFVEFFEAILAYHKAHGGN